MEIQYRYYLLKSMGQEYLKLTPLEHRKNAPTDTQAIRGGVLRLFSRWIGYNPKELEYCSKVLINRIKSGKRAVLLDYYRYDKRVDCV